jgi:hypothetical protein
MKGQQLIEGKVTKESKIMFGTDFILDKGDSFDFIIQSGEQTKKIELKAKTQRSARLELNRIFPSLRNAYRKPDFVTLDYLQKKIEEKERAIGTNGF